MLRVNHLLAVAAIIAAPALAAAQTPPSPAPAPAAIEEGSTVQLEYTLSEDNGPILDTNKGKAPLTFTQGHQQILPALEKELAGLRTGDAKHVVLKPEEAYGPVDPDAHVEVAKEMLPADSLNVGARLLARNRDGEVRPVTVKEVKDQTVVLDLNHPLAGKTIVFDVKVLAVEPPKASPAKPSN
jgi:FKBP-type peptidyl-prolyl cis-trans isomerase SlyD